jgi:exopolyphosphatase
MIPQVIPHSRLNKEAAGMVFAHGNCRFLDLDSIISALLLAYLNQKKTTSTSTLYIPLVKVPSCDLALRPEVTFVFRRAGIDASKLICIDHVDMKYWENNNDVIKPAILLVDHNRLTPPFSLIEHNCQVVGVVDHHVDEGAYLNAPLRWIEMVGSCTSQIVLLYQAEIEASLEEEKKTLATLALAPILVDTIGLRWDLGKTTQKDVNAFNIVASIVFGDEGLRKLDNNSSIDPRVLTYYHAIEDVKSQVDHLCTRDLLRKDYKQWTVNGYTVGTSSMAWYLKAWVDRDGYDQVLEDARAFIKERQLDMLLVLTSYDHSKLGGGGSYERELAFFVANDRLLQVKAELKDDQDVGMVSLLNGWGSHDDDGGRIGFYNQKNIKLSRKQIWPRLQDILLKLE